MVSQPQFPVGNYHWQYQSPAIMLYTTQLIFQWTSITSSVESCPGDNCPETTAPNRGPFTIPVTCRILYLILMLNPAVNRYVIPALKGLQSILPLSAERCAFAVERRRAERGRLLAVPTAVWSLPLISLCRTCSPWNLASLSIIYYTTYIYRGSLMWTFSAHAPSVYDSAALLNTMILDSLSFRMWIITYIVLMPRQLMRSFPQCARGH